MGLFDEAVWIRILSRVVDNERTDIKAASCGYQKWIGVEGINLILRNRFGMHVFMGY